MADQTPMVNGTDISRSPSAPLSTTYSSSSNHPLGFPCTKCKARHRRCDRTKPICNTCQSMGFAAECSYPSAALPVTENKSAENRITQKTGAPFSGLMFNNALPSTGGKRPRAADSPERTELVNAVVGLPIQNDSSHQQTKIPQQSPAKRQKISELGSGSPARQPALAQGQVTPFGTGMPSGSRPNPLPRIRSISPTLREDETVLRCNLTTEINVQRMKHRNLAAGALRNIIKLLKKAKIERPSPEPPSTEPTISRLGDTQLNDEWCEEDDLMEVAFHKLEKGGRCSRALLSRFENFLYGPLMSPEEKRMQERIICVEECLSSASAEPTSNHNELFLHRLSKVTSNPDAYGLDKKDSRIGFLRNHLLTAISAKSKLSRANCKKFAELLDPDGDIANANLDSPVVKAETATSKRKVPPKPTSPRVPSSYTPGSPSRPTRKQNPALSLSPSPTHLPFPPSHSSLYTPHLESTDVTDDTMIPVTNLKRKITKRVVSVPRSQLSQSNDTAASPATQSASKKRPTSDGQSNDITVPPLKRAASGTHLSNPDEIFVPYPDRTTSHNQSSNSDDAIPSSPNNELVPGPSRATSDCQPLSSEIPNRLWNIFVAKHAPMLPMLNLDQLKAGFALAVNHGKVGLTAIEPTFGFCIAIASQLTRDKQLWQARIWYDAARSNMAHTIDSRPSIQFFHHQILQIHYLQIVGHLRMAWDILTMAIGRAQSLRMQTMHGGCLAVNEDSLQHVRMVWQCLWTKKLSLTLQFGVVDQSLDTFYESPMPMQSFIQDNLGVSGAETMERRRAASSFFIVYASLINYTDDLITVENDLRVTRMECPIKWLSVVDLRGFQELNEKLSSWKNGLPNCLEWKGPGIDFTMEKDPLIRCMSVLAHLRFVYFRLRQYRPFFILTLRLSQSCACEMSPHITGKDIDSVDASPFLGLVFYSAVKCLNAAQEIVKTISASHAHARDEHAKCEHLEYLYAAAAILIAARAVPGVMNGTGPGMFTTAPITKSITTMVEELRTIDTLLRNFQESCEQAPKLRARIERVRAALEHIKLQSVSSDGLIMDNNLRFRSTVWQKIYDRLGLDLPFERFRLAPGSVVSGRRMTLGWIESLPVDMDSGN
ncbi:transcriptional regulator family: Fungal Specific TF [Penicillium robsamsonii]|uniref:transcriptional regulator family: Fungal Specific TF n=1 Tax=Penicillium robsamsonii TaxID=1792511 RepID=UPI0025486026|nr:transcriptional regulator family: Fungal Specific TF [Penicillium robsamsonii]KAJ5827192.1 transcriptional regulator family: Fungal Specific TF [Penicillium robsamsonii]